MDEETQKPRLYLRPADQSLEAFKESFSPLYKHLTGQDISAAQDPITEEKWREAWQKFWKKSEAGHEES